MRAADYGEIGIETDSGDDEVGQRLLGVEAEEPLSVMS